MKYPECVVRLMGAGISEGDAFALRRIAMTLHRWAEAECNGEIERPFEPNDMTPHRMYDTQTGGRKGYKIADREAGALRRLAKIMAKYPGWQAYHQGDPRGASLYILRPGDVPEGADRDAYYSRGIAVYR